MKTKKTHLINGFSNANYFCKVFRKYTNQTPTDYRRKN
ncbi:MAG TPA: AraC family transcriptional regulator [Candidatus Fimimorpha faecalis]|uniref:AraC family transcriptional regulator n=1 Tax=Candidatus Fimimorpha faecalis TaxID=2840824 RepID=A0A9D1JD25_9FIRM|nr:AraC family transcriptional regulator [Candidatus Fimimorpha faecalis]